MQTKKSVTFTYPFTWFGGFAAFVMSYWKWHSVGWAILHFIAGWLYVVYYLCVYGVPVVPK